MTTPSRTPHRTRKRTLAALAVLATLGILAWWWSSNASTPTSAARADGGSIIEEYESADRVQSRPFKARLLSGKTIDTDSLRGEVTVYNVWGSWCVPCATEAPDLVEVAHQYGDAVTFMGINVRDNEAAARAFERDYEIPYDSVIAQDSSTATLSFGGALTTSAVPTTLVVDRRGRVAARVIGPATAATLRRLLEPVLQETDDVR